MRGWLPSSPPPGLPTHLPPLPSPAPPSFHPLSLPPPVQCKSEGLKYLLGTATPTREREAFVEVPCTYVVSAKLDGYVQMTNVAPFSLTGAAWSLDGADPLEIEVKMLQLAIEVEVVDTYGHVFTDVECEALRMLITKDRPRDGGWRPDSHKPMVAQRSYGRGGLNGKGGLDILMQPSNSKHRADEPERVPLKPKNVPSKLETKAALFGTVLASIGQREFSLACEYNDYEISHVKVGGGERLESPNGLALDPADWGSLGEHGMEPVPMSPLKLSVVMCRYDLVVLVNDEDDSESNITEGVKVTLVPTGDEWDYHADEIPLSIGHDVAGAGVNRFSKGDLKKAEGRYHLKIETPDEGSWEYEVRKVTRTPMMTDEGLGAVMLGELTPEEDANEEDLSIDLDLDPLLWSAGQPTTTFQILIRYVEHFRPPSTAHRAPPTTHHHALPNTHHLTPNTHPGTRPSRTWRPSRFYHRHPRRTASTSASSWTQLARWGRTLTRRATRFSASLATSRQPTPSRSGASPWSPTATSIRRRPRLVVDGVVYGCDFLLLPITPGVSCSCVDALNTPSAPQILAVSYRLPLHTSRKFAPQPPSQEHRLPCRVTRLHLGRVRGARLLFEPRADGRA